MPYTVTTAQPRVLTDAVAVLADPAAYADRPSLIHLSRLVLASATGATPRQTPRGQAA